MSPSFHPSSEHQANRKHLELTPCERSVPLDLSRGGLPARVESLTKKKKKETTPDCLARAPLTAHRSRLPARLLLL